MRSFKQHFTGALGTDPERLHFAAHSHHPWPDVSREAHLLAWDEASRLLDDKWELIFETHLPRAQGHLARLLNTQEPRHFCFAPNVHELLVRLVSAIERPRPLRVLTTRSEFHSFWRQAQRWVESGEIELDLLDTAPFESLEQRLRTAVQARRYDLIYISQVFFDSGFHFGAVFEVLAEVADSSVCVIDGYHGFMALPTDLGPFTGRIFYVAGGYKYAMAGEGACFMHCPPGRLQRPVDTGWFASFEALAETRSKDVPYPESAARFMGATFDPSPLYRFNAVADLWQREGQDPSTIHARASALAEQFLQGLEASAPLGLSRSSLVVQPGAPGRGSERGNFLAFRLAEATRLCARLKTQGIVTDARADRLRFGFGLYHDPPDVARLLERLNRLAAI